MYGVPTNEAKKVFETTLGGVEVDKTFARWLLVRSHKGRNVSGDQLLTFIKEFSAEDLKALQAIYTHEVRGTVSNTTMLVAGPVALPFICVGTQLLGIAMAFPVGSYVVSCGGNAMLSALGVATGVLPVVGIAASGICIAVSGVAPVIAFPFAVARNAYRRHKLLW